MNFSEEKLLIILIASLALVSSYIFIRRTFWSEEETKEATNWYNKKIGWEVRKEDTEQTSRYIQSTSKVFGFFALVSWGFLFYILNQ